MKKILTVFAALSLMLCAATAQANLITNGSFDDGLSGWTNTIFDAIPAGVLPAWDANAQAAKFGGTDIGFYAQSLAQSFHIAPGTESLTLSFDLTMEKSMLVAGINTFTVLFNSLDLGLKDFVLYSWNSIGNGLVNTTITVEIDFNYLLNFNSNAGIVFLFDGGSLFGGYSILLDNVMLTANSPAVPVPAAVWLLGSGLAGMAALRRKIS